MKNRTRFLSIMLILLLFALMATGCGTTKENPAQVSSQTDEGNSPNDEGNGPTDEGNGPTEEGNNPTEEGNTNVSDEPEEQTPSYVLDNQVIVDNEHCTFTIVGVENDGFHGISFKVFLENKTPDVKLMFSIDEVSINGYMTDPFWAKEVAAGKKANDSFSFSRSDLEEIGITNADEVIFKLRIYNSDDWFADEYVDEVFTVYPTGLSAEEVVYPERRTSSGEKVIVNNDQLTFIILGSTDDNIWGYTLNCFIENKTDVAMMISWDDVSVNGFMIDPFWAETVAPGMRSYAQISFSTSQFEENAITEVENIEFTMRAYDSNNWSADDFVKESFVYEP